MKYIFIILTVLLMATTVSANPFLTCDPDDTHEYYMVTMDNGTEIVVQAVEGVTKTGVVRNVIYDVEGMSGTKVVSVKACRELWGCSDPVPFSFLAGVNAPANLNITAGE